MEYTINNYNLAEITFNDREGLVNYFADSIINQEIKTILLGPNLIFLNYSGEAVNINKESDTKILNTISRLIFYNLKLIPEQYYLIQSGSNTASLSFLTKLVNDLYLLMSEKGQLNNSNMKDTFTCFELMSYFTSCKGGCGDDAPLCDYIFEYTEEGNKLCLARVEILNNLSEDVLLGNVNTEYFNLNIFYMLLYNLSVDKLKGYLTGLEELFDVFDKLNNVEEYVKRFIFVSRFKLLKNEILFENIFSCKNDDIIKQEFLHYKKLYDKFLHNLEELKISDEKLLNLVFSIILISELQINNFEDCNRENFANFIHPRKFKQISELLEINKDKLKSFFFNNDSQTLTEKQFNLAKETLIKLSYRKLIIFIQENLSKQFPSSNKNSPKLKIVLTQSNFLFRKLFMGESNTECRKNIIQTLIQNFIREKKNLIFNSNYFELTSYTMGNNNWPSIKTNDEFILKNLKPQYEIVEYIGNLVNLFTNNELPSMNDFLNKLKNFKSNKIVTYSSETNTLKIKHSFGTVCYDLLELENEISNNFNNFGNLKDYFDNEIRLLKTLELSQNSLIYNTIIINIDNDMSNSTLTNIIADYKIYEQHYFFNNYYNFFIPVAEIRSLLAKKQPKLPNEDITLINNFIVNKFRIDKDDYIYRDGYIIAKNSFCRILDGNKNIASLIYKYNHKMFYYLTAKKANVNENFSKLKFAIKSVLAYIKLTKVYKEKKVFQQIRELLMDIVVKHFPDIKQIDKINEFIFDFKNEILALNLPKLHSNLSQLKKFWKNYISDIIYLELNKKQFAYPEITQRIIQERLENFKTLLFLFSKKYRFVNINALNSVLHLEFTKTISVDILNMIERFYIDMSGFCKEYNFNNNEYYSNEKINFEKLFLMRNSYQDVKYKEGSVSKPGRRLTIECRKDFEENKLKKGNKLDLKALLCELDTPEQIQEKMYFINNDDEEDVSSSKHINNIHNTPNFKLDSAKMNKNRNSEFNERIAEFSNESSVNISPENSLRYSDRFSKLLQDEENVTINLIFRNAKRLKMLSKIRKMK
jgi:hypothetical protein